MAVMAERPLKARIDGAEAFRCSDCGSNRFYALRLAGSWFLKCIAPRCGNIRPL